MTDSPFDQSTYQLRLDWGRAGLVRLAPADIVVLVDVLGLSSRVLEPLGRGQTVDADVVAPDDAAKSALRAAAALPDAVVMLGALGNASAVAQAVLRRQRERGVRTSVAIIPLGADAEGGDLRFAVEDLLGAGAVVAALADLGIDHCSPDAAVAGEGFRALRRAVRHLLTASGTGAELAAAGRRDEVLAAAQLDSSSLVPVLREGVFVAA